jgi:hypothetical protein
VYWCRGLAFFEVLEFAGLAPVLVWVSTLSDTVGEFRSGTLDGHARWEGPFKTEVPNRVPDILGPDRLFRQQCHYPGSNIGLQYTVESY